MNKKTFESVRNDMVELRKEIDHEVAHCRADDILLQVIKMLSVHAPAEDAKTCASIIRAYKKLYKWYA